MEQYLKGRAVLFNEGSQFSCPDSCERYGCQEPNLHVSISLVDLVGISVTIGRKIPDLYEKDCKVGFDPLQGKDPWLGRVSLELRKPCSFLDGKVCSVYSGRPIACALFPEFDFMVGNRESLIKREIFRNYPCIQSPCSISPQRKEILNHLMEMSVKEAFLSDFYLFGVSPFLIDLKNIAGEGLEGVILSDKGKAKIPHSRLEGLLLQKMKNGDYLEEWKAKIERLDRIEALNLSKEMKRVTDQMALSADRMGPRIAYQFDGNKLLPIHL